MWINEAIGNRGNGRYASNGLAVLFVLAYEISSLE